MPTCTKPTPCTRGVHRRGPSRTPQQPSPTSPPWTPCRSPCWGWSRSTPRSTSRAPSPRARRRPAQHTSPPRSHGSHQRLAAYLPSPRTCMPDAVKFRMNTCAHSHHGRAIRSPQHHAHRPPRPHLRPHVGAHGLEDLEAARRHLHPHSATWPSLLRLASQTPTPNPKHLHAPDCRPETGPRWTRPQCSSLELWDSCRWRPSTPPARRQQPPTPRSGCHASRPAQSDLPRTRLDQVVARRERRRRPQRTVHDAEVAVVRRNRDGR